MRERLHSHFLRFYDCTPRVLETALTLFLLQDTSQCTATHAFMGNTTTRYRTVARDESTTGWKGEFDY
jgi:hypothetical protein